MATRDGTKRLNRSVSTDRRRNSSWSSRSSGRNQSLPSPLQSLDILIDLLRQDVVCEPDVQQGLKTLLGSLKQRFGSSWNQAVFEDTVQFAPWLTAKMERLRKRQSELLQCLTSCCLQARRLPLSEEVRARLVEQLTDLAEKYVETETDQECLFHTAFPSPAWTAQPRSRSALRLE